MTKGLVLVLAGTVALNASAVAQTRGAQAPSDPRIGLLEQQLRSVQQQLADRDRQALREHGEHPHEAW